MLVKREHNLVSKATMPGGLIDKAREQADREDRRCSLLKERDHKQLYLDRFESRQRQQEAMVVNVFASFNEEGEGYPDPDSEGLITGVPKSHHLLRLSESANSPSPDRHSITTTKHSLGGAI